MSWVVAQRLHQLRTQHGLGWSGDDGWDQLDKLSRLGVEPRLAKTECGVTIIHYASEHGWLDFVKYLIEEHSCNPHAKTQNGLTPLHYACRSGRFDIVFYLTSEQHCHPHAKTQEGDTPLHLACRCGHYDIVCYLISEQHCNPDCCDNNQRTPLHWLSRRHRECTQEEAVKIMRLFISLGKCDINKTNRWDDTALHLACRDSQYEISSVLLKESEIDPNVQNKYGDTPLHLACRDRNYTLVQLLVRDKKCNPCMKNTEGDTALHVSCRSYGTDEILMLLLEEAKSDPNAKNNYGNTPLHLACRERNSKLVQHLVKDERLNPHVKNCKGDTVLHVACRHNQTYEISKLLLRGDLNAQNDGGDTPLHLACRELNSVLVRLLVRDDRCNPVVKNSKGDTALHTVCRLSEGGRNISKLLLKDININLNAKNDDEDTPLHLACRARNLTLVQLLVKDERCNVIEKNSKGDTAVHVACRHNQTDEILMLLLDREKINLNAENNDGDTPLDLTRHPDITRELIRHGANPQDVYKTHGKVLGNHSSKQPLQTPVKLFMVGNPSAGKSTLTIALQNEAFGLKRMSKWIMKVSGVDDKTAGIVPHQFESKIYGYVTLYDFAGQREFYSGHAAVLQKAIQTTTPIFLVVVDLSNSNEDIKSQIFYWLSFLENLCNSVNSKPHFVVIGSHADILKSRGEVEKYKGSFITSLKITSQFASLEFKGFIAMNCQYADSTGMTKLRRVLKTSCDSLRLQTNIDFNAHCFFVYLLDNFRDHTAITIQQIQSEILKPKVANSQDDINYFLPQTTTAIEKVCDQLNSRGHLLVLKNPTAIESSWVIIKQTALLAEVNGTIFAPKGFKEHINLASSTGVVPLSNIARHFPKHDLSMLVDFLSHFEFCHEISDREILGMISQEQTTTTSEAMTTQEEYYFFFPGLITLEVPNTVWDPQPHFEYRYGWILQCLRPEQFFGPYFLQVLLLRLAFCFAFRKAPSADVPSLQRKCSIWKNGIYWGDGYGIETLVEIPEQNRVVVLMQCPEVKSECLHLRSLLIQKVLAAAREFCNKVSTVEFLVNPSDITQYPLKPISHLKVYDISAIATAVVKGMPSVVHDTGTPISLNSLLSFEPYAGFGEPILRELLAKDNKRKFQIFPIAEQIPEESTEMIKKMFKPSPTQLRERMSGTSIASQVYHMLDIWRATCEGTYQDLREKLDQFSIFAGRNPLEIAGVSCESNPEAANGIVAVTEIAADIEHGPYLPVVLPEHVGQLAALLDDLVGSWYRFAGLLGLSEGKRRHIQLDNAWKPDGAQLCLLDALCCWVKSDESATYEKITTILQKHFPNRSIPLIEAVQEFAEEQAPIQCLEFN